MLTFFQKTATINPEQIDNMIRASLEYFSNCPEISNLITQKQSAFLNQLAESKRSGEKKSLLLSYAIFAETLTNCINNPSHIDSFVHSYYSSPNYRHVGGENGCYSYTLFDAVNSILLKLSIAAFILSFVLLPFTLPMGLVAVGISLSIFLPTAFYALAETKANEMRVRKEEATLFNQISVSLNSQEKTGELPLNNENLFPNNPVTVNS